ncbi:helix-turn-helix domain-containing protein [Vibrio sp. WXL103]|uniref:AraC family transcriptional regulator n=1 Tax=Vibrio sp. WXL103 TaxID=3450710 RepID=UPI003EC76EF7
MLQTNIYQSFLHSGWIELLAQSHPSQYTNNQTQSEEYCSLDSARLSFSRVTRQGQSVQIEKVLNAITSLTFGNFSLALTSAPTIFSVFSTACDYSPILTNAIGLRLNRDNKDYLEIEITVRPAQLDHQQIGQEAILFYTTTLLGMLQLACKGRLGSVEWLHPDPLMIKPHHHKIIQSALECHISPTTGSHRLRFYNLKPFTTINPNTLDIHQTACKQLENKLSATQLSELPEVVSQTLANYSDLSQVNVDAIARSLGMTSRTLNRKLSASNTHFRSILNHHKLNRAVRLISTTNLSMSIIADKLGFTDSTTFSRAFKQWTGHPPSKLKRLQ